MGAGLMWEKLWDMGKPVKETRIRSQNYKGTMQDSKTKSLLKTLSWRLIATLITMLIAWVVVGDVSVALTVGAADVVIKMIAYYFHERAWTKI